MSDVERTLEEAASLARGSLGWLLCVLQARSGLSRAAIVHHARKLRATADKLEELL